MINSYADTLISNQIQNAEYPFDGMSFIPLDYDEFEEFRDDGCITSYVGVSGPVIKIHDINYSGDFIAILDMLQTRMIELQEGTEDANVDVIWSEIEPEEMDRLKYISEIINYFLEELVE